MKNHKSIHMNLAYLLLIIVVVLANHYMRESIRNYIATTFDPKIIFTVLRQIGVILLGAVLGLERFLKEYKKEGKWQIDKPRLFTIGLCSFIISIVIYIPYMIDIPNIYTYISMPVIALFYTEFFQILLGYTIVSSFEKKGD